MNKLLTHLRLYRWLKGGLWAYYEGAWSKADKDGYHWVDLTCNGRECKAVFHHTFNGVQRRENYGVTVPPALF